MVKQVWKRMLACVLAFAMVICDAGLSNLVCASEDEEGTGVTVEAATVAASASDEDSDAEEYLEETLTAAWNAGLAYVELDLSYGVTSDMVAEAYEDYLTYDYMYFYVYEDYKLYGVDSDDDGSVDILYGIYITYGLEDGFYGTNPYDVTDTEDLTSAQLADIKSMQQELTEAIEEIVDGADEDWTDVEKALYLNDYLTETCQYDQDAYEQNITDERITFTIYGALINHLCVCQGYANAFVILARELGLEAELVDSSSLGHQWNAVEIDGIWYLLDVTWDDPIRAGHISAEKAEDGQQLNDVIGKISHTYFLKSLDYFCDGTDHTTHLDEDDWVFTGGLTKADITGSAYDEYFWDEVRTPFIYDSEREVWYAMVAETDEDATSLEDLDSTGRVYAYTFSMNGSVVTYKGTELFTVDDEWYDENLGTLKLGLYSLDYYGGLLYYSTTDTVYVYDIDAKTSTYYYGLTDDQQEIGDIYGMKIDEDGTLYAQISKSYDDVGTIVALCNVKTGQKSIADTTITLSSTSYDYDGTAKKPTVTIKNGSTVLKEGTDYRIEYPDDVKNAGTKTITVTGIGAYNGTTTVSYTIEKVNLQSSDVGMKSTLELTYGQTTTPYSTYTAGSETHDLTTSKNKSGDESIVTITNGEIQAVGVGETVIYYYIGDEENYNYIELPVVVSRASQTVSTVGDCSLTYGSTATVSASTTGDGTISFSSSKSSVAYVEIQSNGTYKLITAGVGTATITVKASKTDHYNSASKTFKVTVTQASQYLSVATKGASTLYAGESTTWKFATTGDGTIKYTSSDTSVATVSSKGVVTTKSAGVVTITVVAQKSTNYKASDKATVTMLVYPAATSSISLSSTSKGVKITWKKVAGADGYYIYRGSSANPFAQVTGGSTVTYTDTSSKTNGTKYTYKIVAYYNYSSGAVLGKTSSSKSITYKYLAKGSISSLTNAASGVTVKWSKVTGASGYYIYRDNTSTPVKTIKGGTTVSWTDTSAKSGTTYKYYVAAYYGSYTGTKSAAKTIKRLSQGKISSTTNVASGVTVKWSKVTGASGYYIYRGSSTKAVATVKGVSTTSWTDTSAVNGTSYTYYVVPYSGSYKGAKSSKTTASTIVRLSAVTLSSVKNSASKAMTVTYTKNSKATGYKIEYSTSSKFTSSKTITVKGASTLSKKITGLTKNKTYYVRVRAYKTVGSKTYYSAYCTKTKSVKISK